MQQFDRISSGVYMPNGTAGLTNSPTPFYSPGEIGCVFGEQNTGFLYQRVQLDSGATSATTVGVVAANQLAYWKDRANNIVTNDPNFNDTGTPASCVNRVAGVFQTAVTAAPNVNGTDGRPVMYVCDVLIQGRNVPVKAAAGVACIPGTALIADGTTGGVKSVASATTAPTEMVLGITRSSTVSAASGSGTLQADINIPYIA